MPLAILIVVLGILTGCSRQYFHEGPGGDRYYQTAKGDILRVSRTGYVWKESEKLGVAQKNETQKDWDLTAYNVVPPSGHCVSPIGDGIEPAPCWALIWQLPLQIFASPVTAVQDAVDEGSIPFTGESSSPAPAQPTQGDSP
jgi:hypothetical protein